MPRSTNTTATSSLPIRDSYQVNAITATLPPTELRYPESADDAEADAHNKTILAVRGLRTTAICFQLAQLTEIALMNHNIATVSAGFSIEDMAPAEEVNPRDKYKDLIPVTTFEPFYFFFYGSLQDPSVLTSVCDLLDDDDNSALNDTEKDDVVVLRQGASIGGWKVKMWGQFPALVPATAKDENNNRVKGVAWLCEEYYHVTRLCSYESSAYRLAYCDVEVPAADGNGVEVLKNARTFVSTLEEGNGLEDGEFNLEEYQQSIARWWS
ncbi:hypothetical protein F5Y09DRAFT_338075 [Xylaria sp. FL1042]|nr:hypothetical protein F5Y09DRAFT_338075 [Xylaria sp. FL1042]